MLNTGARPSYVRLVKGGCFLICHLKKYRPTHRASLIPFQSNYLINFNPVLKTNSTSLFNQGDQQVLYVIISCSTRTGKAPSSSAVTVIPISWNGLNHVLIRSINKVTHISRLAGPTCATFLTPDGRYTPSTDRNLCAVHVGLTNTHDKTQAKPRGFTGKLSSVFMESDDRGISLL